MSRLIRFLAVAAAGAAWRYFADPVQGRGRRERVMARFRGARHTGGSTASTAGDTIARSSAHEDDLVAAASVESFPASDPPSYWAREVR